MILKMFSQRRDEFFLMLVCIFIGFVIGVALLAVIISMDGEQGETFLVGTLIMLVMLGFVETMVGTAGIKTHFNLTVGMGITRKKFLSSYLVISLLIYIAGIFCSYVMSFAEKGIISVFYPDYEYNNIIEKFLYSPYILIIAVLLTAVQFCVAGFGMKYGNKAYWIAYALFMVLCLLASRTDTILEADSNTILAGIFRGGAGLFTKLGPWNMLILLLAGILLFAAGIHILRKQQVTD